MVIRLGYFTLLLPMDHITKTKKLAACMNVIMKMKNQNLPPRYFTFFPVRPVGLDQMLSTCHLCSKPLKTFLLYGLYSRKKRGKWEVSSSKFHCLQTRDLLHKIRNI